MYEGDRLVGAATEYGPWREINPTYEDVATDLEAKAKALAGFLDELFFGPEEPRDDGED